MWKVTSLLSKYTRQAKKLIPLNTPQAEIEKAQLIKKLSHIGLIQPSAKIEDILSITLKDILNKRLQTLVYKNKLSRSVRQARQFIVHGHIAIGEKKIANPSYLVAGQEETLINFVPKSPLFNQDHPERVPPTKQVPKIEEEKTKEKKPKKEEKAKKRREKKPR